VTLIAVAHGSRDPRAAVSTAALIDAVQAQRPDAPVRHAFLELAEPLLGDALSSTNGPTVVVPLLLSAGYHVHVDLPQTAQEHQAVIAKALGPDPLLAEALADRLREAGWKGEPVVMAAAGSRDERAVADSHKMGRLLSEVLKTHVTTSFVSAAEPAVADAVRAYDGQRVAVATYLLAPGFFADEVIRAAGDHPCSAPLGAHPAVASLVWRRNDEATATS
jgi:sirohydrochlorin ferrochelatase